MAAKKPPRIEQASNGNWYVHFHNGKRDDRSSLRTKDSTEAQARFLGWLEQRQRDAIVEEDPTVSYCLDLWFDQHVVNLSTYKRIRSVAKNLRAGFGQMRVSEITRQHSADYTKARMAGKIGRSCATTGTCRLELQELRACMRFMCERVEPRARRLPNDMMPYFDLPPASPPRDRIITPDEWDRYYDFALNQNYNGQGVRWSNRRHRIQTFILLAGETAQRKTAITTLSYDQVHWDHGKYGMINFLPAGAAQTNKRRPWVPMTQLLRSVLEQAYEQRVNDLVLDKVTDVKSGLDRVNQQLGIEGVTPHTFRHTWATNQIMAGKDIKKVAEFMGDTEKTVRENYEHLAPNYLEDFV